MSLREVETKDNFKDDQRLSELANIVSDKRRFVSNSGNVPIVTILEESILWLNDSRPYSRQHLRAWESVINDLDDSASQIGPSLSKLAGRRLTNLLLILRTLPIANERAMRHPGIIVNRRKLVRRIKSIRSLLSNETVMLAAWKDLVGRVFDDAATYKEVDIARDIFIDIADLQAKDLGSFGLKRQLSDVLRLEAATMKAAQIQSKHTYITDKIKAEKPLTTIERLTFCEELITEVVDVFKRVVWIEVKRASLHKSFLDCGDILLFDGEWLMAQEDESNIEHLPVEVKKNISRFGNYLFSGEKHTVLARISLGDGMVSSAYDEASELLKAFIQMADSNKGDWVIEEGHLVYVDNVEVLYSGSRSRVLNKTYNHHSDSMSERIENESLDTASVNSDKIDYRLSELRGLIDGLSLYNEGTFEPNLLASTRLLEHITSWTNDSLSWHQFSRNYLKSVWARSMVLNNLDAHLNAFLFTGFQISGYDNARYLRLRKRIITESYRSYYSFNRFVAVKNIRTLSRFNDIFTANRSFKQLSDAFLDGRSLYGLLIDYEKQFDSELNRLVRYRNAMEHGGPKHLLIAENTTAFASAIAGLAGGMALNVFLEGQDLKHTFERRRLVLLRKYSQLSNGGDAARILGNR